MKKIAVLSLIILSVMFTNTGFAKALESTPSGTVTPATVRSSQISELKERIATKVAELKILAPSVISGTIKTLSDQKIVITVGDEDLSIDISEDTTLSQFDQDQNKKSFKIGDLKTDQKIVVWGTLNKETNTMTADTVISRDFPLTFVGQIKSVDKKNYQFLVQSQNKDIPYQRKDFSYLFDVNPPTKISLLANDNSLTKIGFSKLIEGQTVYIYGFIGDKTKDSQTLLSAKRIIVLSQPVTTPTPSLTPTATPKKK